MTHRSIGDASRVIRSPRGNQLSCRSWLTEAAFRMIQNNLDPEVAENPAELEAFAKANGWASDGARAPKPQALAKIVEAPARR